MIYIYHRFIFIVDTVFWIVSCLILLYNSLLFFDCVESYQSSSLISIAQMILSFSISACMLYNLSFFLSLLASSFLSFLFKPFSLCYFSFFFISLFYYLLHFTGSQHSSFTYTALFINHSAALYFFFSSSASVPLNIFHILSDPFFLFSFFYSPLSFSV